MPGVGPDRRPDLLLRRAVPRLRHRPDRADAAIYESCTRRRRGHGHDRAQRSRSPASSPRCRCRRSRCRAPPRWRSSRTTRPTTRAPRSTPPREPDRHRPLRRSSRGTAATRSRSTRNDDYWGETGQLDEAVFVAIDDPKARADALTNGEIDGFDLVGPADIAPLEEEGFQIVNRDAVQRALPRHEPEAEAARRHPGPPGHRPRHRQGRRRQRLPARGHRGRDAVHARPSSTAGPTTSRSTSTTRRRPRSCSPRPVPRARPSSSTTRPTSAGPTCRRRRTRSTCIRSQLEAVGLKVKPDRRPVGPGLPGQDPGHAGPRHPPARLDRRLQRHRQLPRRLLRRGDQRVGLRQPELFDALTRGPRPAHGRGADPALRGHQRR